MANTFFKKVDKYDFTFGMLFFKKSQASHAGNDSGKKLRLCEEKFNAIFQNVNEGIAFLDIEKYSFLDCNSFFCNMLGYSKDEVKKLQISDIHPKDALSRILKEIENVKKATIGISKNIPIIRKDGTNFFVDIQTSLVSIDGSLCLMGIFHDISDKRLAVKIIREEREKLLEAQRIGRFGNFDWDARTDTITWSDEYYRIYGFEIGTKPPGYADHLKTYTPETAARLDAAVKNSMKTGSSYVVELERIRPDGSEQWIIARGEVKRDEKGKIVGLQGTAQDITEIKIAQEKKQELETSYRRLFEATKDGILLLDAVSGVITDANPYVLNLLGYTLDEFIGKKFWEVSPLKNIVENKEVFKKIKKSGFVRYESLPLETKDGRSIQVEYISNIYTAGKKQVVQCNIRDISERKKTELKLRELAEVQSKFIDIISHQLRTPLTAVNWNLEMLLNGEYGKMDEAQRKFLKITHLASLEITHRIYNLLTAMDVEEGRVRYVSEDVMITNLCAAIFTERKAKAELKSLEYTFSEPQKELPPVFGDGEKIRTAITELIENAIDYTKDYGKVSVSLQRKGERIRFEVTDTGIGVPKAEQHYLFRRFFRASNASVMKPDGFGLGLYLSKHFIEQHQGTIGFESEEGKGSTFWFEVPLKEEAEVL